MQLLKYAPAVLIILIFLVGFFVVKSAVKIIMKIIIAIVLVIFLVIIFLNLQEIRQYVGDMVCSSRAEELRQSQKNEVSITGITPEMVYEGCMEDF